MRSNPDPADFNEFPSWSLAGFPDSVAHRAADQAAGRTASELVRQPLSRSRMKEIAREVAGSPGAWEGGGGAGGGVGVGGGGGGGRGRGGRDPRGPPRLYGAADYEVWLESW